MPLPPKPSKLLSLKEWLTLDDASKRLSVTFGEEVTRADVLRLALDGRLTLSVNFVNHARARKGCLVPIEKCTFSVFPRLDKTFKEKSNLFRLKLTYEQLSNLDPEIDEGLKKGELYLLPKAIHFRQGEFLVLEEKVESIDGVWDLPMVGGEEIAVEHRYQMETDGPPVTLSNLEGAFVVRDNVVCQLQDDFDDNEYEAGSKIRGDLLEAKIVEEGLSKEKADELRADYQLRRRELQDRWKQKPSSRYFPAGGLPHDSIYVVRTAALRAFEEAVLNEPSVTGDKPLSRREETTLLNITGGLLGLLLGKSPAGKAHSIFNSQAAIIEALLSRYPGKPGMSARTLEDKFALARRSLDS